MIWNLTEEVKKLAWDEKAQKYYPLEYEDVLELISEAWKQIKELPLIYKIGSRDMNETGENMRNNALRVLGNPKKAILV
jgi:hypothetical protein